MDIEILSTSGTTAPIFGSRNATGSSDNSFVLWKISASAFRSDYNKTTTNLNVTPTGRHLIDKNKNTCKIDNTTITHTAGTFQSSYNMILFGNNGLGTIDSRKIAAKLYYCKIFDTDVLIRDYVPARVDGVIGLYDLVNNKFGAHAGAYAFAAGPSV